MRFQSFSVKPPSFAERPPILFRAVAQPSPLCAPPGTRAALVRAPLAGRDDYARPRASAMLTPGTFAASLSCLAKPTHKYATAPRRQTWGITASRSRARPPGRKPHRCVLGPPSLLFPAPYSAKPVISTSGATTSTGIDES